MSEVAFSIVVPCYNEEASIAETVETLTAAVPAGERYEIIVVDDGSTDRTPAILEELNGRCAVLRVLRHERNAGYGAALKTGIRAAAGPFVAITDADGTYPNERLPELVAACRDVDMVVGARTGERVTYSKLRAFPKIFLRMWVTWIAGRPVPDINSGMRVMRKAVVERFFPVLPNSFSFTITITLSMLTNFHPTVFVPIDYHHRTGRSKIRPIRDTLRFASLILRTGVYFAPLRAFLPLFSALFVLALASLAYDVFVVENLTDKTVLLFLFSLNVGMFMLLADMIDKRSPP